MPPIELSYKQEKHTIESGQTACVHFSINGTKDKTFAIEITGEDNGGSVVVKDGPRKQEICTRFTLSDGQTNKNHFYRGEPVILTGTTK